MFSKLLVERMIRSFLAAAGATLLAGLQNPDLSTQAVKALAVATIASGISACITLVTQLVGDPDSTSFLKIKVEDAAR